MNTEAFEMETMDAFEIPEEYFEEELFPEYPIKCSKRSKRQRVKAWRKNKFPVGLRKQLKSDKRVDFGYMQVICSKKQDKFYKKKVEITLQDMIDEEIEAAEEMRAFYEYQDSDEYYFGDYSDPGTDDSDIDYYDYPDYEYPDYIYDDYDDFF